MADGPEYDMMFEKSIEDEGGDVIKGLHVCLPEEPRFCL